VSSESPSTSQEPEARTRYVTGSRRRDLLLFFLLAALIVGTGIERLPVYYRAPAAAATR
jgi:hypothetical protein